MIFNAKEVVLKDGTKALLRSPRIEDAEALLEYLSVTACESEFLLQYPEERKKMTVEQEEQFIQNMTESATSVMILCEIDGRIAGNCQLSIHNRIKTRHRGSIGIALYKEFWGRGIGTAMMTELIALGKELGLMQLELEFVEGNERGYALYRKMGFEVIGVRPDAFRLKNGTLLKEFMMMKKLV